MPFSPGLDAGYEESRIQVHGEGVVLVDDLEGNGKLRRAPHGVCRDIEHCLVSTNRTLKCFQYSLRSSGHVLGLTGFG